MAIDVDSSVLWLGVGRGVRVIGSGDIGRILAFLALWVFQRSVVWLYE